MATKAELGFTKNVKDAEGKVTDSWKGNVTVMNPETLDEAAQMFGSDVALALLQDALDVKRQAVCRSADNQDAAQKLMDSYMPGIKRKGTGAQKVDIASLTIEQLQALIAKKQAEANQ